MDAGGILFSDKATWEIMTKMLKTYRGMVESMVHWKMLEYVYIYIERERANMGICWKILSELENMRRWRQDMAKPSGEMPDEGHQMGDVWKQE